MPTGKHLSGTWQVTVAALIARIQIIEMPFHFNLALDNSVKPSELSEIITHLAFYSGWGNATGAVAVAKEIFAARKIGIDQLPAVSVPLLPINEAADYLRNRCRIAAELQASLLDVGAGDVEFIGGDAGGVFQGVDDCGVVLQGVAEDVYDDLRIVIS